jgi:hypothetical protein
LTVTIFLWLLGLGVFLLIAPRLLLRLQLSRAKHRSLAGHAKLSRRLARLMPHYEYDESQFFRADDAPEEVGEQRRAAFRRLAGLYAHRFANTVRLTQEVQDEISDLQFTARYRVPFQFSRLVRQHLNAGSFVVSSNGPTTTDLDGNRRYDLTGSYGVNVFGYDFYKECIERGSTRVRDLGPPARDLGAGRNLLPHVGNRSGDAGRAPGALPHPATLPGTLLRLLPRLVGGGATRRRQPGDRTRHAHTQRYERAEPARAAQPAGHRLCSGEPAPGPPPECRRAVGFNTGGQRPPHQL